jgi:NAD(P)-dependent dehydrogenase (short-subunit alcohol dehydrogenase family)
MKKVALITGVASGIGAATAKLFALEGWYVIGVDRCRLRNMKNVREYVEADVSQVDTWKKIGSHVEKNSGRLDALVNNAAFQLCRPIIETTPEEWDSIMAVNVRSVYLSVRHMYPFLRGHGAGIVIVSSVHALATSANIAAYAASKGALSALTRALAIELAVERIRVNAVLPGAVDTPMLHEGLHRGHLEARRIVDLVEQLGARHPVGRVGRPQEIAEAVLFLAENDRSSFITGQALIVDGGAMAKLSTE